MDARTSAQTQLISRAGSYPLFDWLRFVLASVVALDHSGLHGGVAGLAVQVFFALSGWLIGGILLRTEIRELPRFFFKRGTRIWIPYALAAAALYGFAALRDGVSLNWFRYLFFDATFTHNWFVDLSDAPVMPLEGTGGHFWSISVEEQFYLAAPLMMMLFARGKRLATWVAVLLFTAILAYWNVQFVSITLGVIAAIAHRDYGEWHNTGRIRLGLGAIDVVTLAIMLGYGFLVGGAYNILAPIFAVSMLLLTSVEGKRSGIAVFLGGLSYPLYLNHWMGIFALHYLAKQVTLPDGVIVVGAYAVSVGIAAGAYMLVDEPILKYRDRFYTRKIGMMFMSTAYVFCCTGLILGPWIS